MELDRAIIEGPCTARCTACGPWGREIGAYDISTVYRAVIKLAVTPRHLARRLIAFFGSYFPGAEATLLDESADHAVISTALALPLYLCQHGIVGFLSAALEMSAARRPVVEHTACLHRGDARCEWRLGWEA